MASFVHLCSILFFLTALSETISNNVCLMEQSYEETMKLSEKWDEHITTPALATIITFTGHFRVQDAFKMLQNWITHVEKSGKKTQIVEISIAGKMFAFKVQIAPFGKRQIYIRDRHGSSGMKYIDVYDILEKNKHIIDQRDAASYILVASAAFLDDEKTAAKWEEEYPFLAQTVSYKQHKKIKTKTLREILNEIMVIGQVAEAAAPTKETFTRWMEIIKTEGGTVLEVINKEWKQQAGTIIEHSLQDIKFVDYSRIFQLTGELNAPDLEEKAKQQLTGYDLEYLDYDLLIIARENAIDAGMSEYYSLLKGRKVYEGRVPFADEVFRLTLQRIQSMPDDNENSDKLWRTFFDEFFPMSKKGGTKIGKFDIVFNEWIRNYANSCVKTVKAQE